MLVAICLDEIRIASCIEGGSLQDEMIFGYVQPFRLFLKELEVSSDSSQEEMFFLIYGSV